MPVTPPAASAPAQRRLRRQQGRCDVHAQVIGCARLAPSIESRLSRLTGFSAQHPVRDLQNDHRADMRRPLLRTRTAQAQRNRTAGALGSTRRWSEEHSTPGNQDGDQLCHHTPAV